MFLSIEFPFVDIRSFLEDDCGRLRIPNWPGAIPNVDFVRSFGIIRKRPRGGLPGWIGESPICEADRALRFAKHPIFKSNSEQLTLAFYILYRRLYFDGLAAGKYTVGLANRKSQNQQLSRRAARELFYDVLRFPTIIPNPQSESVKTSLWAAGNALTSLYANSSVLSDYVVKQKKWWVRSITPIVFLIKYADEDIPIPFPGQQIPGNWFTGFSISQHTIAIGGIELILWVITLEPFLQNFSIIRDLRISISRLYTEYNCLLHVLRSIAENQIVVTPRGEAAQALQGYLEHALKVISRKENRLEEIYEPEIVEIARESMDVIDPAQRDVLINSLQSAEIHLKSFDIRLNIRRQVQGFVERVIFAQNYLEGAKMGDQYTNYGQAGAMGQGATGTINNYNQAWQQISTSTDLAKLAEELSLLRSALRARAKTPEEDKAIGAIADAEIEAKNGNGPKVLEYLATAGKWVFDVAKEIGVKVAVEVLKQVVTQAP